jgi:hypothetical protein
VKDPIATGSRPEMPKLLSVLVGCYGNFPHYSLRAVDSVLNNCHSRDEFNVLVGCNECSHEVLLALRSHFDEGRIELLVESRENINKDPMMRVLIHLCRTPYILWLDDDSHVLAGWDEHILKFIKTHDPFDVAGHTLIWKNRSLQHKAFLRTRTWYHSRAREKTPIKYPHGGLFVARTEFLRKHDYPDRNMVQYLDDTLLGELCQQQEGKLINTGTCFNIRSRVRIGDGIRRGSGEGIDGWKKD